MPDGTEAAAVADTTVIAPAGAGAGATVVEEDANADIDTVQNNTVPIARWALVYLQMTNGSLGSTVYST